MGSVQMTDRLQMGNYLRPTLPQVKHASQSPKVEDGLQWKQKLNWHSRVEIPITLKQLLSRFSLVIAMSA